MAKKGRKKKEIAIPQHTIDEVNRLSKDQLVKRFIAEESDLQALEQEKKGNTDLKDLKKQIKDAGQANKDQIDELKERIKELKEDEDLDDLKKKKKDLEGGDNDEIKRRRAVRNYVFGVMRKAV